MMQELFNQIGIWMDIYFNKLTHPIINWYISIPSFICLYIICCWFLPKFAWRGGVIKHG
jgi:Na+-driven multidrug efflux pump